MFFTDRQLRRTVREYVRYYNEGRPHQGIRGIPVHGPGRGPMKPKKPGMESAEVISVPVLGGLIQDYKLAA